MFAATSPGVALVHQSPLRQELLNQTGSRFFPNEVTTDNRGVWRESGQPFQLRQITPPFPTTIGNYRLPDVVPTTAPGVVPSPVPVRIIVP
mgnify:CR=1 FL=1